MSIEFEAESQEYYMRQALLQAQAAIEFDEVPVGAVIERQGRIIAAAHNQCIGLKDATAHAEMLAITQAAQSVGDWRLEDCRLFVTLEPCVMCAGAIVNSRIPVVVFGTMDPKAGAAGSLFNILDDSRLNHRCQIISGILSKPCGEILTEFFRRKRIAGKK
jgi:tRNA(adenine34) deaminase